jgi:hypothetical protein
LLGRELGRVRALGLAGPSGWAAGPFSLFLLFLFCFSLLFHYLNSNLV